MRMIKIAGFCLGVVAACGSASAQSFPTQPSPGQQGAARVYNDISVDEVIGLLNSAGGQGQLAEGNDDLILATAGGQQFAVGFYACSQQAPKRCGATMMFKLYPANPSINMTAVNTFNMRFPPAKAFQLPDTSTALARFVLWGEGITAGNFLANLRIFLIGDQAFRQATSGGQGTGTSLNTQDLISAENIEALNKTFAEFGAPLTSEGLGSFFAEPSDYAMPAAKKAE